VPTSLLHNLKHNKVLHERVLFVTVQNVDEPEVRVRSAHGDCRTGARHPPGHHPLWASWKVPNIPRELERLEPARRRI